MKKDSAQHPVNDLQINKLEGSLMLKGKQSGDVEGGAVTVCAGRVDTVLYRTSAASAARAGSTP